MKHSVKIFGHFFLLCLFLHLPAFSLEDDANDEFAICTFEQLSALTSDEDSLIGGLISPLSGNARLRQLDFTVIGAQEIPLSRIYVSPYMPALFHKYMKVNSFCRKRYLMRHYEGWKFFPHQRLWLDAAKHEVHHQGETRALRPGYFKSFLGRGLKTPP